MREHQKTRCETYFIRLKDGGDSIIQR